MGKIVTTFDELVTRVNRQEEQVLQLIKIVAATNKRISEVDVKQKNMDSNKVC